MSGDPKQILILGGGFAGVYTARYLEKLLRPEEASITLINRENYWVYQPMLPDIISGSIGLTNVVGQQELLASLDRGAYFGEMALLSNRTRNATIRACSAMDVLIIPKIDFDKLRQSVPAFGNVFNELAKQRAVTDAPH